MYPVISYPHVVLYDCICYKWKELTFGLIGPWSHLYMTLRFVFRNAVSSYTKKRCKYFIISFLGTRVTFPAFAFQRKLSKQSVTPHVVYSIPRLQQYQPIRHLITVALFLYGADASLLSQVYVTNDLQTSALQTVLTVMLY